MVGLAREQGWGRRVLPRLLWFGGTTLVGGGCDLQTKAWAERTLSALPDQAIVVIDPWLELALAYNRGTAFSVLPELGGVRVVLGVLALLTVVLLAAMVVRARASTLEAVALGAIAGGAIGNGIDRVFRAAPGGGTGVVDFIKLNYPWGGSWPTFNVADALVALGVIGIGCARLWLRRPADSSPHPA